MSPEVTKLPELLEPVSRELPVATFQVTPDGVNEIDQLFTLFTDLYNNKAASYLEIFQSNAFAFCSFVSHKSLACV